jgi:hypothetical protein
MKKLTQTLGAALVLLLLVSPQLVSALEIEVTSSGQVIFYQGRVLGEDSQGSDVGSTDHRQEVKTISPQERKDVLVRTDDDKLQIEVVNKDGVERSRLELREVVEADGVRLEFPSSDSRPVRGDLDSYQAKLLEQRQERAEEMVQLRNRLENGENRLELKARHVTAKLSQGASFNLDPETNQVTITTPSGEEHILYHLPDQAILRMQEVGLLSQTDEGEEVEAEIEITEDGDLIYQVEDDQHRRFLGLFPREVPVEIELDDDTGEVSEQAVEDRALFQRLLDRLSF